MIRLFLRSAFIITITTMFIAGCEQRQEPVSQERNISRPNILLVMADDMGWTDIGGFGGEIDTPNLDMLAQQGIKFTDFHVSVSCSPTRSMLLSGNDNHVAGLGNMAEFLTENQTGQPGYEGHLNKRVASLAEVLRSGGYHTYMSGKWHLGHEPGTRPFDRGFERSFSMLVGGASHWGDMLGILPRDHPARYSMNGEQLNTLPADFYSSRSYADFLIDTIRENKGDGKPFLAYLAFTAVHDPVQVPEPWLSKYRGKYNDGYEALRVRRWEAAKKIGVVREDAKLADRHPGIKPWAELSDEERALEARGMEVYAGMLEAMDYHYGRVVDFLKDIGEYDNTVIIFLSDNGANPAYSEQYPGVAGSDFMDQFDNSLDNIGHAGSNYAYGMGFSSGSSGPLDKFKLTVGEGGIRSPLIISGPGIKGGQQTGAFTNVMDIMPTILEMTGVDYITELEGSKIEPMRGRSMLSLLDGTKQAIYDTTEFFGGEMNGDMWMRQGDFKAQMVSAPFGTGTWQLFNLAKDPGEASDLSGLMPEKLEMLKNAWDQYAKDVGVVPRD
jgi:arylsulfatase A-like enzyme